MTDNYEFQESIVEQSLDDETVFSKLRELRNNW